MKYTTYNVQQIVREGRKGKPWQARAKYKDATGKWKEVSKMLPEAKGKKEAMRMAKEWFEKLNAEADLMPNAGKAKTVDEIYKEYLKHQLDTGEIERSTYSNSLYSYNKYIKPYLGDYVFATVDKTILSSWLTKLYQAGLSQNTIHTTYARLKKVYNYFYNNGELLKDPFKGVKMPKKGEAKVTHLNNEQEVNAGVAAGGRTGMTSLFCGLFFFVAMFLSPIAQLVPSCTTAAALIYVGFLMLVSVKNINWDNLKIAIPAFLTLAVMPFTYNISYGIAFGLISYIVISVFCGDFKKIKGSSWVIAGLFVAMLLLTH